MTSKSATRVDPCASRGCDGDLRKRHRAGAPARGIRLGLARALLESIQAIENRERFVGRRALTDGGLQQTTRLARLAAIEGRDAVVQQFLGLALPFGERAASPFDVGAGTRMVAVEKQRARPDVDRLIVVAGEVVIEAGEQQLLDLGLTIRVRHGLVRARGVGDEADRT